MSLEIDLETKTISIYQGDSGEIVFESPDIEGRNLNIYMAVRNANRELMFPEIKVNNSGEPAASFFLTAEMTDKLVVPKNAAYETYYYGFKGSEIGSQEENTYFLEGKTFGDKNLMIVYPKEVEGGV